MNDDQRGWRGFAAATMLTLFFGLLILIAVFDAFFSRFLPIFLGLLSITLIAYAIMAFIVRTVMRIRRASHADETKPPR